jgi:hypothetical protein
MSQDLIDYFMRETDKRFSDIQADMKTVKRDLEKLLAFRILLLGLSAFVAGIVSLMLEVLR